MIKFSFIIFSDLDGTLLDHYSYMFSAAQPALDFMKENHIPLILISSKTRSEMIHYQKKMNLSGLPFVVENGSAVFTPIDFFEGIDLGKKEVLEGYDCYNLGISFEEIKKFLDDISKKYRYTIRGFHNISRQEVQSLTGLNEIELERSLNREYSIPLLFDRTADEILKKEIDKFNLKILYGGRFMHLLSRTDKGNAMKLIIKGYRAKFKIQNMKTIAVGDSLNDLEMLKEADFPILVKKHDNSREERINIENLVCSPGIGPVGWNESVLNILKMGGNHE